MTIEEMKNLSDEQITERLTAIYSEIRKAKTIQTSKIENVLSALTNRINVKNYNIMDNTLSLEIYFTDEERNSIDDFFKLPSTIEISGKSITGRERFFVDLQNNNCYNLSPLDKNSFLSEALARCFMTYSELITNKSVLTQLRSILYSDFDIIIKLIEEQSDLEATRNLRVLEAQKKKAEKENADIINELKKPENADKFIAGLVAGAGADIHTGLLYRNRPVTVVKIVSGQFIFDDDYDIDHYKWYHRYGKAETEEEQKNHKLMQYTTPIAIRQLKSETTNEWINRPKKK